jgi:Zinc carboxypeptidase
MNANWVLGAGLKLCGAAAGLMGCVHFNTLAVAQERPAVVRREQAPPVLARYPDLPIKFDTPALKPGRTTFTSQAELEAYIATLPPQRVSKLVLGMTPGGRVLPALLFSREGVKTIAELAAIARPIVWLIGQQHGNEPAGSEAMLALARALADGELSPILDHISVVVVPRANPDGAATDTRDTLSGADLNRDHALLEQPETKLLHALARQLRPAVVVDAHEFTVGRRWVEQLGGLQAVDLMLLSATHPMVPEPLRVLAANEFLPAIERAIGSHKLTSYVYHTMSSRAGDRSISIGGNAQGIARNAFGLMGAVSILIETRGVGIGLESYQRRVATHYLAAKAVLETAAQLGPRLASLMADVGLAESRSVADVVLAHTPAKVAAVLPLIDAATGQDKSVSVDMLDTRIVTAKEERARPLGFLVPAERSTAFVRRLDLMGVRYCTVPSDTALPVERYAIVGRAEADPRAINPERSVTVRLTAARGVATAGTLFVPLDQPQGARLALALEPDAPGSWTATELGKDVGDNSVALERVPRVAETAGFAQGLMCKVAQ